MSGPAKAVETMSTIELLRDLADTMRWPRWFDTDEGERYAEAVRPRLAKLADVLELVAAAGVPRVCAICLPVFEAAGVAVAADPPGPGEACAGCGRVRPV